MQIKLPLTKIKDFLSQAKCIEIDKSELMPVTKYIKVQIEFGTCYLFKSNYQSFCKFWFDCDEDDCEFLILEDRLDDICADSDKEWIIITLENESVNATNGLLQQKYNQPVYEIKMFPEIPVIGKEFVRIGKDVLNHLKIASIHTNKDTLKPTFNYVYLKDSKIFATSGEIVFLKELPVTVPDIPLSVTECNTIANFEYVNYSKSGNFNTYSFGNITYGFVQNENAVPVNYKFLFENYNTDNFFVIGLKELSSFCKSTIRFTSKENKGGFSNSRLSVVGGLCTLIFEDRSKNEENKMEFPVVGNLDLSFVISPEMLIRVLDVFDYENICISDANEGMVYLWSKADPTYKGILRKMQSL